jgi:hypothetical protein
MGIAIKIKTFASNSGSAYRHHIAETVFKQSPADIHGVGEHFFFQVNVEKVGV